MWCEKEPKQLNNATVQNYFFFFGPDQVKRATGVNSAMASYANTKLQTLIFFNRP